MTDPDISRVTLSGDVKQLGASLQAARDFVMAASQRAGLDKQAASRLRLAVDEVATNIIQYGYGEHGLTGDVVIESAITPDKLRVSLFDWAIQFNPLDHDAPTEEDTHVPLDTRDIGGWGIFLVIKNVDDFYYEYVDGKNCNHFIMNRKPQ